MPASHLLVALVAVLAGCEGGWPYEPNSITVYPVSKPVQNAHVTQQDEVPQTFRVFPQTQTVIKALGPPSSIEALENLNECEDRHRVCEKRCIVFNAANWKCVDDSLSPVKLERWMYGGRYIATVSGGDGPPARWVYDSSLQAEVRWRLRVGP